MYHHEILDYLFILLLETLDDLTKYKRWECFWQKRQEDDWSTLNFLRKLTSSKLSDILKMQNETKPSQTKEHQKRLYLFAALIFSL